MKRITFIITTILIIVFVSSSTYAWLTYVQRKSLASLETHEITITLNVDETLVIDQINFNHLAFIDYQNDLILNETETFDLMASTWTIKLETSADSPMSRNYLTFAQNEPGLIYLLIYRGTNGVIVNSANSFYDLISTIIAESITKEEQLAEIILYNQSQIEIMNQIIYQSGDYIEFEVAAWADYEGITNQAAYLDQTFDLLLTIQSINSKGEVTS